MRFQVRYKYSRNGKSWTETSVIVTATSDYMAERIVQGKHPGCEVIIREIKEC